MALTFKERLGDALERLDYLPQGPMLALGVGIGMAASMGLLFGLPTAWALVGCGLLLVGGTWLGLSGRSIELQVPLEELDLEPVEGRSAVTGLREPPHPVTPRDLWVDLPGGTFLMGSPEDEEGRRDNEGPQHEVTVSAFQIMNVPVTRGLYEQVVGEDPGWPEADDGAERPVNQVDWYNAVRFCNALSEAEGLAPCYEETGDNQWAWHADRDGYRLPTEAEWEYACRAESTTRFCFGDDEAELSEYAWFEGNSGDQPRPVGQLKPNDWGLHDMHGNVWEWCWDDRREYSKESVTDPVGPTDTVGSVLRGGSYWSTPRDVRSANRFRDRREDRDWNFGFRCVRGHPPALSP